MSERHIVELVVFAVKDGVTTEQFLATVDDVTEWLESQPGFVSRDLSYAAADERWIDIVYWRTVADAQAAATTALSSALCTPMFDLIDPGSVLMLHGTPAGTPVPTNG